MLVTLNFSEYFPILTWRSSEQTVVFTTELRRTLVADRKTYIRYPSQGRGQQ